MKWNRIDMFGPVVNEIAFGTAPRNWPGGELISYTQLVWKIARELKKPVFVFVPTAICELDNVGKVFSEPKEHIVDLLQRRVFRGDERLELSCGECEVLEYVFRHRGETVSREMLARDIWQDPLTLVTNVIDV